MVFPESLILAGVRVLLVQRFDLANVGCAERIWRQGEELAGRGHKVVLVQFPHPERRETHPRLRPDFPEGVRGVELDRRAGAFSRNRRTIQREVESTHLVHLWKAYPDIALPVLWALKNCPKPLHYDWDDLEGGQGGIAERLTESPSVGRLLSKWEREILEWADTVTVASGELERLCLEWGFPQDRLFPGPVGAVRIEPDKSLVNPWRVRLEGKRNLIFLGQMEAEDFPLEILEGFKQAAARVENLQLILIGDGSGRARLEQKARELEIYEKTLFTGYLPWEEAQAALSVADASLFPLKDDPMSRCKSPLVVVEALSHGVPVIGSSVGEVPKMVGDAGILVSGTDPKEWADAIVNLLEDRARLSELKEKAWKRHEESWTWERSVDRLEEAYEKAIMVNRGAIRGIKIPR